MATKSRKGKEKLKKHRDGSMRETGTYSEKGKKEATDIPLKGKNT